VLIDPVLPTAIRFTDVGAQSQALHIEHGLLAVIALVGDECVFRPKSAPIPLANRHLFRCKSAPLFRVR
jgi:hypothetical protein